MKSGFCQTGESDKPIPPPIVSVISLTPVMHVLAAKIGGLSAFPVTFVPQLGLYEGKGAASGAEEDAIRAEQIWSRPVIGLYCTSFRSPQSSLRMEAK